MNKKLVALCACPMGLAHTFMAAVAITPEGMERFDGCEVYEVELQEAIKNAEGVIKEIEEDLGI